MATGKQQQAGGAAATSATTLAFWYVLFMFSSVGMTIGNKFVKRGSKSVGGNEEAILETALFLWQNGLAIVINYTLYGLFKQGVITDPTWDMKPFKSEHWLRLIFPTINFGFILFTSLQALAVVNVATVTIARNVATVLVAIGDYLLFSKTFSTNMKAALSIAFLGSLIYSYFDLKAAQASGKVKSPDASFEQQLVGYAWQVANTLFFVFGQLYEKWAMTKAKDQTPLGISTIKNTISLPVFIAIGFGKIYFSGNEFTGVSKLDLSGISAATWFTMFMTGVGCFAISICYMTLYKISEATTITVGGNFNKIVSIFIGSILFSQPLSTGAIFGLSVSIAGSLWYSFESIGSKKSAQADKKKSQ